jgi:hypothetical protein
MQRLLLMSTRSQFHKSRSQICELEVNFPSTDTTQKFLEVRPHHREVANILVASEPSLHSGEGLFKVLQHGG